MRSEAKWQEIDQLLAAVAEFSRSNLPEEDFVRRMLGLLLQALPCAAAGYWMIEQDDQSRLTALRERDGATCSELLLAHAPRLTVVQQAVRSRTAAVAGVSLSDPSLPPEFGPEVAADRGALLACPVILDNHCVAVIELIQDEFQVAADRKWSLDVLGSVAELCADDCRKRRLSWLTERELLWRRLRQFGLEIQRNLDVNETAYAVVNDGRPLIDCDRLTLLSADANRCRVLAVSGAATCDPRSDMVRYLEQVAGAIAAVGSPVLFPGGELPPEVREPLMAYLDVSGAKSLAVVPLSTPGTDPAAAPADPAGVVVAEVFSGVVDSVMHERLLLVAEHVAPALQNARRFRQSPWTALVGEDRWRRLTRGKSRLKLWLYG
ncbi:MAG TPA: GAF domain-containing protein, partial [Planctomycetaceae bacterium]